ncbi:MAG: hypothetical protein DMG55_22950 [Acidobacteria bacterium]|nr:MAG: hypothetical protein DMG55_22950 [Acidobacteriota bacterium]
MTSQPKDANLIWLVLHVFCLAALVGLTLLPTTTAAQSNPIVLENQQPGTTQWQIPWGSSATDSAGQIKGYASAVSVNKGQNITFYVSVNPAQTYTIDVYRMGWYQGLGGRLVQHIGPLNGTLQPACPTNATTGMIECQWASAYTLATQSSWTSGIYVALLTNAQKFQNYIVFAVRDDSRVAALLYQQPVTTYQAYNNYPDDNTTGKSLYAFNSNGATTISGGKNAVKVSFDRPYEGNGTGNAYSQSFFSWEYPFVRWMEKSGYDVTYATDIDTHSNGGRLLNYRGFLSVGHDEYWSKPMYDAVMAARDAGVSLGFFSANAIYWQARFESSSSGVPNRVEVCYRDATLDPVSDPTLKTVLWRDPPLNRPEQTLMGVQYTAEVPYNSQIGGWASYVVTNSGNWVYAGTGFKDGDTVPGIDGYEADRLFSQYPPPNAVSSTYTPLSNSALGNGGPSDYSNSSVYQAPSGAWVFAAGTIAWSWGLDNFNGYNFADPRIQQTTANVLNAFLTGVAPTITTFTPESGPVGTSVTIGGTNFMGATAVTFNGSAASFTVTSDTAIQTTVPAGATTGPLSVTTPAGTATSASSFAVVVAPTITSFTPSSGPVGTSVTIGGTNFMGATAVTFNGSAAAFTVTSDTAIQTTVPAGATTGPLSVTTPAGTALSASNFTLTVPLTVTKTGLIAGGTVKSSPAGIACGPTCSADFNGGTVVTLTATPGFLSIFTGWEGCDATNGTTCTVTMNAQKTVTANFLP